MKPQGLHNNSDKNRQWMVVQKSAEQNVMVAAEVTAQL